MSTSRSIWIPWCHNRNNFFSPLKGSEPNFRGNWGGLRKLRFGWIFFCELIILFLIGKWFVLIHFWHFNFFGQSYNWTWICKIGVLATARWIWAIVLRTMMFDIVQWRWATVDILRQWGSMPSIKHSVNTFSLLVLSTIWCISGSGPYEVCQRQLVTWNSAVYSVSVPT